LGQGSVKRRPTDCHLRAHRRRVARFCIEMPAVMVFRAACLAVSVAMASGFRDAVPMIPTSRSSGSAACARQHRGHAAPRRNDLALRLLQAEAVGNSVCNSAMALLTSLKKTGDRETEAEFWHWVRATTAATAAPECLTRLLRYETWSRSRIDFLHLKARREHARAAWAAKLQVAGSDQLYASGPGPLLQPGRLPTSMESDLALK